MNDIDPFDVEEEYFGKDTKGSKTERKRKSAADRSKYKKSDLSKWEKEHITSEGNLEGIVIEISSRGYLVQDKDHRLILCQIRGSLKEKWHDDKTLVAIGDRVFFVDTAVDPLEGMIDGVLPRRSELVRQDNLTRRKKQILAANIDLAVITVSVGAPPLRPAIIDRYLIAARKGGMRALIVINKADLFDEFPEQKDLLELVKTGYADAGVPLLLVSSVSGEGLKELAEALKDKISVFSGPSGVGKSSLLTHLTGIELVVGDVVERTGKGAHTTTNPRLIPLLGGGLTIDTPGIKSFGLFQVDKEAIKEAFSEWDKIASLCRFSNCSHRGEDGCAVEKAALKGKISPLRYASYLDLMNEIEETYRRR